jgi:hypothetical protein
MLDASDPLAAILEDETFAALKSDDQTRVLAELKMLKRSIEAKRDSDAFEDRERQLANCERLRSALTDILDVFADGGACIGDLMDWLASYYNENSDNRGEKAEDERRMEDELDRRAGFHYGSFTSVMAELRALEVTSRRLLLWAETFKPEPGRKDRGGPHLKVELKQFAFDYLIELIEGVGVRVTSTTGRGNKGSPGARLLAKLLAGALGCKVSMADVKRMIEQRRRGTP